MKLYGGYHKNSEKFRKINPNPPPHKIIVFNRDQFTNMETMKKQEKHKLDGLKTLLSTGCVMGCKDEKKRPTT